MSQISKENIIAATLSGVEVAFERYMNMAGEWLDFAPEYYVTSSIAHALHEIEGAKYVTLEHGMRNAMENAGAISRGRYSHKLRRNGRCDLLLWRANNTPRAIIEVKSPLNCLTQNAIDDLLRIEKILLENAQLNSFQFGLFCFYSSQDSNRRTEAEKGLENRFNGMVGRAQDQLKKSCIEPFKKINSVNEMNAAWMAGCFCISAR